MSSGGDGKRKEKDSLIREMVFKMWSIHVPQGSICPVCREQLNPECRHLEPFRVFLHLKQHTLSEIKSALIVNTLEN